MFTTPWNQRKSSYDFVVIGSGYGGAVTAARIASANLNPKPSICILERGKERWPGNGRFPDTMGELVEEVRSDANPIGMFEFANYRDISVVKGCGLGGTSLINANVAATPDEQVFDQPSWPALLRWSYLKPYYDRARKTLGAGPDPRAATFLKVQAMERRAAQIGKHATHLDLAINFTGKGKNEFGVPQGPCRACGNCTTGCNRLAKRTLYMNYLPMARNAGAQIFTQTKVHWIEKLAGGRWRVHGESDYGEQASWGFKLEARNVILAAGSLNSTELLMRSEKHGLSLPASVGTRFSCNGDFFGLAYNGDYRTLVTGFPNSPDAPDEQYRPGPAIVSAIHYNGALPLGERFQIEDLSIPAAYIAAARRTFPVLQAEDTHAGSAADRRKRIDLDQSLKVAYDPDGALNHTMFYLVMGMDDARGRMVFESSWHDPEGSMRVVWDEAGRQRLYTRLNEELRRHARALGASFIPNPIWSFLDLNHLITAHPIGGCPVGEDAGQGAIDEFGRVFQADGSIHDGLFVADGSVIPSSIGVNPFLTISALSEHIAERKIRDMQGDAYPQPRHPVAIPKLDPMEVATMREAELDRLFRIRPTAEINNIVNTGKRSIDISAGAIRNDGRWRGFFPKDHVLNAMSSALFTGFTKQFRNENGRYLGVTSDTDGNIQARNTLEEVIVTAVEGGPEPGRYLLLRYLDPPWQGFYDLLKVVDDDVVIGRVYLGEFPHGVRMFTFSMTRSYALDRMNVEDHRDLYTSAVAPSPQDLDGMWRMDVISNANELRELAFLEFESKPDGHFESRYRVAGLIEGLVTPKFLSDHFELSDFTPFHDEIRKLNKDLLIGKYMAELPDGLPALTPARSLGILHAETERRFGFYYLLARAGQQRMPTNSVLRPFLDAHLPDGLGMTFDEEMVGWYAPGQAESGEVKPPGAVDCSFKLRMTVKDLNEFIEGAAHEAKAAGTVRFGELDGQGPIACAVDPDRSWFRYLTVNPMTAEAEIQYWLEIIADKGQHFLLDGRKYLQKDRRAGRESPREVMDDFTTLFGRVYTIEGGKQRQVGTAYLKFRTFEDFAATGSFLEFLKSFQVTGTEDPLLRTGGVLRFLAFTAAFVQHEFDPLAPAR